MKQCPSSYAKWLVREILQVNIEDLNPKERFQAITYSWMAFMSRNQLIKAGKENGNVLTKGIKMSHPEIEAFEKSQFSPEFLNQVQSKIEVNKEGN